MRKKELARRTLFEIEKICKAKGLEFGDIFHEIDPFGPHSLYKVWFDGAEIWAESRVLRLRDKSGRLTDKPKVLRWREWSVSEQDAFIDKMDTRLSEMQKEHDVPATNPVGRPRYNSYCTDAYRAAKAQKDNVSQYLAHHFDDNYVDANFHFPICRMKVDLESIWTDNDGNVMLHVCSPYMEGDVKFDSIISTYQIKIINMLRRRYQINF